jgi:hypothetical protein
LPCRVDDSRSVRILVGKDRKRSVLGVEIRVSPSIRDTHVIQLLVSSY